MSAIDDKQRLHEEIEQTREELGETVEALAAKADVKARASEKVQETKAKVVGGTRSAANTAWSKVPAGVREKIETAFAKVRSKAPGGGDDGAEGTGTPGLVPKPGLVARARANPKQAAGVGAAAAAVMVMLRKARRGGR